MTKYRLELTEKQLRALDSACEVCARFKIGQPGIAGDLLALTDGDMSKIRSWYGPGGGLVTDRQVPGISEEPLSADAASWYGGPYLIAESMTESAAKEISTLLGLKYCGKCKK